MFYYFIVQELLRREITAVWGLFNNVRYLRKAKGK